MSVAIRQAIARLADGRSLDEAQAEAAMESIMAGEATPAQIGAFLMGLRMKGETPEEVAGCAKAMRRQARTVGPLRADGPLVDTCGTGGDASESINVSTAAAFVVAGAGVRVAKHGNRSVSSRSGSADVLEALGVAIDLGPEEAAWCLDHVGIAFLFAPVYHPAMRNAGPPRKELGVRTVFNILGPLTNPAGAQRQLMGVYAPTLVALAAGALQRLGSHRAMVVHGLDGFDELSVSGTSLVCEVDGGAMRTYHLEPESVGLRRAAPGQLQGGTPEDNARILRAILAGERDGPGRDMVLLNAAGGLWAAGLVETLRDGVALAREVIDSGRAAQRLDALVAASRRLRAGGAA